MKKILVFATNLLICAGLANAAVRDGANPSRTKSDRAPTQSRVATTNKRATNKTAVLAPRSANSANKRAATSARSVSSRVTAPRKSLLYHVPAPKRQQLCLTHVQVQNMKSVKTHIFLVWISFAH